MNYEKKYKDALEIAKKVYHDHRKDRYWRDWLTKLFPELKESEDEKIRLEIRNFIWGYPNKLPERDKWLAWLEKQEEKKLTYKVEPKFKVGDWIADKSGFAQQVLDFRGGIYTCTHNSFTIDCESNYHLWTIEDAKDGDVLYSIDSKQSFIYKERPQFSQARGYCCINKFGEFAIWNTSKCVICTDKYIPATKEQRDLLFEKMTEAGYEWDAQKKEVKKIEVVSKESEDERIKKQIRELLLDSPSNDLCRIGIDVEKTLAWLEKRGEKDKPKEWCAEDEQNLNVVLSFIPDECLRRWLKDKLSYDLNNKLDADKVIAWIVANICDFEYYVKWFKKDFGL